jgi:hypothetical protein
MMKSLRSREGILVLTLAAAAALRVFLFASAFPFFTNVDEHRHVDLVLKYARGYAPLPGSDAYEPELPGLLARYGSPEYHVHDERFRERGVAPPSWQRDPAEVRRQIEANTAYFARRPNMEAYQPPLYYAIAGGWLAFGRAIGVEGGALLYWVRQLNAVFAFALVLVSYAFLREIYPERALMRLAVPALLVAFPLDVFYYVTRDALPPLLVALGFFLALRLAAEPVRPPAAWALTGGVAAAAFLCKYNTVVLLGVYAGLSALVLARRGGAPPGTGRRVLLLWSVALVPIAVWLLHNQLHFGSWTATADKVARLGWGEKPVGAWLDHPLFSVSGIAWFVAELVPQFWRGEIVWHREVLSSPAADHFYLALTLVAVVLTAVGLRRPGRSRVAEGMALGLVVGSAALLGFLSLLFEFSADTNPTAERPFFVQGRLVSGALVPLLLVVARGVEVATAPLRGRAGPVVAWICIAGIATVSLASEIRLSAPVFASAYNWFHLP